MQGRILCGITAGAASPMIEPTSNNKHTMKKELLFVGLDVHAKNITVALAEGGGGEARLYGAIPNDLHALEKVFTKLKKAHPGAELRVCYEAGPTGFVLSRRCAQLKVHCTARPPTILPSPFLLLGSRPVAHPQPERGADQDRPARRAEAGPAAPGRRADRGACARRERRSHARPVPRPH